MAKLPYMQFYPGDWLLDTQPLSPSTRGIWIDVISFMWRAEPRTGTMGCTAETWCKRLRCSDAELRTAVLEFKMERVCDLKVDEAKDIIRFTSRRIVRDEKAREGNRACQERLRERGGGDPLRWAAIRVRILERDKYICGYCGKKARTVDHIHPKCKGGDEHDDNLVACCKTCKFIKNSRSLTECGFTLSYSGHHAGHKQDISRTSLGHKGENQNQNHISESESESEVIKEKKEKRKKDYEQLSSLVATPTMRVWQRYEAAYVERYQTAPVRNAKVNGQLSQLVKRIGEEAAPEVAAFYVWHNDAFYVRCRHPPGFLLRDCEGLHTQWKTGTTVTQSQARKIDETQGRVNVFQELINERKGDTIDVKAT